MKQQKREKSFRFESGKLYVRLSDVLVADTHLDIHDQILIKLTDGSEYKIKPEELMFFGGEVQEVTSDAR